MSRRALSGPRQNSGTYHSSNTGGARMKYALRGYYGFSALKEGLR